MKKSLLFACILITSTGFAQSSKEDWKKNYRAVPTKINDLIHTKLNAKFDYSKSQLNGNVWISLKPHFYPTDSLLLDAKGMDIKQVAIVKSGKNSPLKYQYNGMELNIHLDKTYTSKESYTIYIDYNAKPNELEVQGSAAISDAKGLYFINPKGEEKNKPTQIWTQGETEATSVWIPTIDKTNQKSTQEFNLTVPAKYVTLSNGLLKKQTKNSDGTRTDNWVMNQPHAPYLFFVGVGDYAVVKDSYKGKEVSYYVEKEYEKVARKIFGNTPEMMKFFSEKLGIEYPWAKYSQIVGRDYVSGAMENTTATLHQESAQQDARELTDGNSWKGTIAHELFHQWFGDYVTAESWSNLTVNESFADYSQLLWEEYKHGADAAAWETYNGMRTYFGGNNGSKDLVRFYYADKEDMFDGVSYAKGGRILHMLRKYVGDDAFFKSLNKYLTDNKFGNGSAHKLRLSFEAVTGKDLNWYFNQWYFGSGHPKLDISYGYNADTKMAAVYLKQTQGSTLFKLPLTVDVYEGAVKKRHMVWANNKADTFYFPASNKPDLINVDAEKITLAEKKDAKTLAEYAHEFKYGGLYLDRREALDFASRNTSDPVAFKIITDALNDPYFRIRVKALGSFGTTKLDDALLGKISSMAKNDPSKLVKAEAIKMLGQQKNASNKELFTKAIDDSSYTVAGAGLEALALIEPKEAYAIANQLAQEKSKGALKEAITNTIITNGDESAFDFILNNFNSMPLSQGKFISVGSISTFLAKVTDLDKFKKGVDAIAAFRDEIPSTARPQTDPFINGNLKTLAAAKEAASQQNFAEYVKSKLPK